MRLGEGVRGRDGGEAAAWGRGLLGHGKDLEVRRGLIECHGSLRGATCSDSRFCCRVSRDVGVEVGVWGPLRR